jgi:hypothetical protein
MRQEVMISICDKSGVMAEPWAAAGCVCICVDIQHSQSKTRKHGYAEVKTVGLGMIYFVYGDARSWKPTNFRKDFFEHYKIVFVACFPVCTNVSGSGAQYWELKGLAMLSDALLLFNACEQIADWSGAPYCIENPVGCIPTHHRKPDHYFHPWFYGDLYQKYTCLWTGNGFKMPEAKYLTKPGGVTQKIWLMSPGIERQDLRSETPRGFAQEVFVSNFQTVNA